MLNELFSQSTLFILLVWATPEMWFSATTDAAAGIEHTTFQLRRGQIRLQKTWNTHDKLFSASHETVAKLRIVQILAFISQSQRPGFVVLIALSCSQVKLKLAFQRCEANIEDKMEGEYKCLSRAIDWDSSVLNKTNTIIWQTDKGQKKLLVNDHCSVKRNYSIVNFAYLRGGIL